ncbi:MAG TPA: SDR family oxidoreductase [Chitinophaga sp.]|uniref:SDR family NAD(P)-dependent oxidoreductase n=1 Tax=Chitinophaga sp. TaxID=1869181 RepID=UPI002CC2F20B|nr:SDR family oxidoreductase [Chitinophaga sp.]HVI47834.1 SDR family oxidoreductase [Chitinophaga sp.]
MQLLNKHAVIYGAGGSLGNAVAKAFAAAGARLFLTGHRIASVQQTADEILAMGGYAEALVVDALDEKAVNDHISHVVKQAGTVDISFNLAGIEVKQEVPLVDLSPEDFVQPITLTMRSRFLTAAAAGKVMMQQGSGVILSLTATPGGIGYPYTGGFAPACCALESFSRNLASELGAYGVRVVNIRSGGSPDSRIFRDAIDSMPELMATALDKLKADTMLKQLPLMADIAGTAVFLASDMARMITGVTIDVTAGTTAALNYRAPKTEF